MTKRTRLISYLQSNLSNKAFSLTWPSSMQIYRTKLRKFLQNKSPTPTGLVWNTNMAAVSLFWDTNMAAVTSCENTLYGHTNDIDTFDAPFSERSEITRQHTKNKLVLYYVTQL